MIKKLASIASACAVVLSAALASGESAPRITPQELKALLKSEKIALIDVRTPGEHKEAHIPGSILMPLDTLASVKKLPEGRPVIYCRSGRRSLSAIDILSKKGFTGLVDLEGGIVAWEASGGEVVRGK